MCFITATWARWQVRPSLGTAKCAHPLRLCAISANYTLASVPLGCCPSGHLVQTAHSAVCLNKTERREKRRALVHNYKLRRRSRIWS